MSKRQLLLLSLVLILILGNGNGMANMIPVYLSRLGIDPARIGVLFSFLYLALAAAGILAGWLSDRFQQRKLMCIISAAGEIFASLLLLYARTLPLASIALFISWFLAGFHMALVFVLVGLQSDSKERGRVFGILGFVMGIGPILSGFLYGGIVDKYGFSMLFTMNVAISILWTILTFFYKEYKMPLQVETAQSLPVRSLLGGSFLLLVLASSFGWVTINAGKLGISMVMNQLNFSAGDISMSAGIASLVALTMPLILGWLSDFVGRRPLMIALNLLGIAGLLTLSQMHTLSSFCVASSLFSLYSCFSGLCNALTADLIAPKSLGVGLSLMSNTSNIAGIFSSTLLGLALACFGVSTTFLLALVLPLLVIVLLVLVQEKRPVLTGAMAG
jgi:MFS family permease